MFHPHPIPHFTCFFLYNLPLNSFLPETLALFNFEHPPEENDSLSNDCATTNGADQTAELFSGSESGQFKDEKESVQNGNEEDSLEAEEGGVGGIVIPPRGSETYLWGKRTNSIKVEIMLFFSV